MRKNHSKIVCIKLVHLPYLYIYDARSHLYQIRFFGGLALFVFKRFRYFCVPAASGHSNRPILRCVRTHTIRETLNAFV